MHKRQTVLITGAGRGIGLALAQKFAAEGYDLILNHRRALGRSAANLRQFIDSDEVKAINVTLAQGDIADPNDIEMMFNQLKQQGIEKVDHLILNAAQAPFKNLTDMTLEDWKPLLYTNLIGNVTCVTEAAKMMPNGGTVCAISSLGGHRVLPRYPLGIMKSALENLVRYLEVELYGKNIRVNGICPGMVNTDMAPFLKQLWPKILTLYEQGERRWLVEPEEVANIAAFLVSDQSSAIRGTTIVADLGVTLQFA